jgi:hypothetical protein
LLKNAQLFLEDIRYSRFCGETAQKFPGGYCVGATPVPIPNTEVKPYSAENTASNRCGKIGHCRDIVEKPVDSLNQQAFSLYKN